MDEKKPKNLYTVKEAADFWGVTTRSVYRWIFMNRVKVCRTPGGGVRIDRREIIAARERIGSGDRGAEDPSMG